VRNRGELSEGWYDPSTFQRAMQSAGSQEPSFTEQRRQAQDEARVRNRDRYGPTDSGSESDESIGPALPGQEEKRSRRRAGPSIPNMDDLELKRGIG
jgi:hypothetical protein